MSSVELPEGLQDGDKSHARFSISELIFDDQSTIRPVTAGVTVVVGSNNVGKSTLLRDLQQSLARHPGQPEHPSVFLKEIKASTTGVPADMAAWLVAHSPFTFRDGRWGFLRQGTHIMPESIPQLWQSQPDRLGQLYSAMVYWADASQRIGGVGVTNRRDRIEKPPEQPLHYVEESAELFKDLDALSQSVFGLPLFLDRISGQLCLRVGKLDLPAPPIDAVPDDYVREVAALPTLDQQGDGIRSFFGLLLPLMTSMYQLILVDEPEAFLHPPQAVALGQQLARLSSKNGVQIIAATHNRYFLIGSRCGHFHCAASSPGK